MPRWLCAHIHLPSACFSNVALNLAMSSFGVPLYLKTECVVYTTTATWPAASSITVSMLTTSSETTSTSSEVSMPFHVARSIGLPDGLMMTEPSFM